MSGDNRRLWAGRTEDGTASVILMDGKGRKRLALQVTADGSPAISFFDEKGVAVQQLTPRSPQ